MAYLTWNHHLSGQPLASIANRDNIKVMYRKELISILQNHPTSLHELAQLLEERPKDVEDDLHHLIKSLRNMSYHAVITPATCKKCGFVFHKDKLHKPGKRPRCHDTSINEPLIRIEERR